MITLIIKNDLDDGEGEHEKVKINVKWAYQSCHWSTFDDMNEKEIWNEKVKVGMKKWK